MTGAEHPGTNGVEEIEKTPSRWRAVKAAPALEQQALLSNLAGRIWAPTGQ